mgnify:CR=1 FL=1
MPGRFGLHGSTGSVVLGEHLSGLCEVLRTGRELRVVVAPRPLSRRSIAFELREIQVNPARRAMDVLMMVVRMRPRVRMKLRLWVLRLPLFLRHSWLPLH